MSIKTPRYRIRMAIAADGERMPLLLEAATGLPVFHPNLYVLVTHRALGRQANTIKSYLSGIAILLELLEHRSIDLVDRLRRGVFLTDYEIDAIVAACRERKDAYSETKEDSNKVIVLPQKKSALWMKDFSVAKRDVARNTAATRIREAAKYLKWYGNYILERLVGTDTRQIAAGEIDKACSTLAAKAPDTRNRNRVNLREGLSPDELKALLQVLAVGSSENPFKSQFIQVRNQAIIYWLVELGVRRGELLGIKIHDIDFDKKTVRIMRRPSDKDDPRKNKPTVKTFSRELPIDNLAFTLGVEYIAYERRATNPNHAYMFVARNGAPLDTSSLSRIFETIRDRISSLPEDLSSHRLRHTWNDMLSEKSDKAGWTDAEERAYREYMMGWKKGSHTAEVYTRRTTRLKAAKAVLEAQNTLYVVPKANEVDGSE